MISSLRLNQFLRFLIIGTSNTLLTFGLYCGLNTFLPYRISFTIAFFLGIILAYWLNSIITFRTALSWKRLAAYPLIYLTQYLLSAILLSLLVETYGMSKTFAPLLVTVILLPVTFLMNKWVLEKSSSKYPS